MKIAFFIIGFFITSFLSAQNNSNVKMSKERFNYIVDSLTSIKSELLRQKEILTVQIDSLEKVKEDLKPKIVSARRKQLIRKYGKKIGMRLAAGKIWKGMTEKMLKDSWGEPDRKTRNKKKWGLFTQWYYGTITYFFKNGILTDWEEK